MNPILLHKVTEIVAESFGAKIDDLTPDTRFAEDLHESLEHVEAFLVCEEAFGISIPDEDGMKIATIGQLVCYVETKLGYDETVWPPAPKMPEVRSNDL